MSSPRLGSLHTFQDLEILNSLLIYSLFLLCCKSTTKKWKTQEK